MDPTANQDPAGAWIPYAFAGLQTVIAAVLGYISKLLRDIRGEIASVKMEVSKHDVLLTEAEKREQLRAADLQRRIDRLEQHDR